MAHWFLNTPGIGSIIVFAVGSSALTAYLTALHWIQAAPPDPESADETMTSDVGE